MNAAHFDGFWVGFYGFLGMVLKVSVSRRTRIFLVLLWMLDRFFQD